MNGPRVLVLDIETYPAVVETWGLHGVYISIDAIREPGGLLGVGYKWRGQRSTYWLSGDGMIEQVRDLIDECDALVTYNGRSFDEKHLKREILMAELAPPSPYKSIDLYQVVRRNFRFESKKLGFVAEQLGVGSKASTGGYALWKGCMAGDEKSWAKMARYCKQDVKVTESLLERLLPWIKEWPHVGLFDDLPAHSCPRCGSTNSQRRGRQVAVAVTYARFQCQDCGSWFRSTPLESKAPATRAV